MRISGNENYARNLTISEGLTNAGVVVSRCFRVTSLFVIFEETRC